MQIALIWVAAFVAIFMPVISDVFALGIWIYLVWYIQKKQIDVINNQADPATADRLIKRLKVSLAVGGLSIILFIIAAIAHNVIYGMTGTEEIVFLITASLAHIAFVITIAAGLVIFLQVRQNHT